MNFLENLSVVWQKLSLVQRAMLIAILVAGGITAVFLTKWASKPNMRPLYTGVSAKDGSAITDKLRELNIPYELHGPGNIYVPMEQVDQMRQTMAGAGLPSSDSAGYSLLSESKFGSSPFLNDVNFKRAQEGELAKSIQSFDTITSARVHIVQPEKNPFAASEQNSTASVFLNIKPGYTISPSTVAAITHMVAGSIEGLNSSGVTVVDSHGNLLSNPNDDAVTGMANSYMNYKAETEKRLAAEAQEMLEIALGPGRSKVMVSAEVDMDSEVVRTTTLGKAETISETIESTTETKGGGKNAKGDPIAGDQNNSETIKTEKSIPETITETTKMAGKILSISVAVIVDLTVIPPVAKVKEGDTAPTAAAPTKIMQVADVEELMLSALGKSKLTKENLTVKDVPFNRAAIPEQDETPWHVAYIDIFKQSSLGIMAICALLALKVFSGKVKPGKGGRAVSHLPGGSEGGIAALQSGDMREQISIAYRSDPEQVKELFTSWIEEKG
ncbi:MAG: flagellar M-ring protein FliF [Phycisphaerae bacterium]|nr:flagellar M-ring protein FliF [Phycisphaerae bacterium]